MRVHKRKKFGCLSTLVIIVFLIIIFNFLKTRYNETLYQTDSPFDGISEIFNFGLGFDPDSYKTDDKRVLKNNLKKESKNGNEKAEWIVDNFDYLDDTLIYLAGNDSDTIDFVYNYSNDITNFEYYPGQSYDFNRKTPYFLQWDNRWAYDDLGDSVIGIAGCGPTSMSMALARLNGDISIDPQKIASDAQNYMTDEGIAWAFFYDEASKYGYGAYDIINNENSMIEALDNGPLIISVNRGYFTLFGHIIVIDSYQDGKFIINDPNSIRKSQLSWTYDQIKDQIAHIWLIS